MLCFRDMTFCSFWQDCRHAEACRRSLTDEVRAAANRWWSGPGEPPIAQFSERPPCHDKPD